jgi:hypothetical protein
VSSPVFAYTVPANEGYSAQPEVVWVRRERAKSPVLCQLWRSCMVGSPDLYVPVPTEWVP